MPCVEDGFKDVGRKCDCDLWYCGGCVDDCITTNYCYKCEVTEETICAQCSYFEKMERCEGECGELLCDGCVCRLACGNNVRLCGDCDYDCEDCIRCAGEYLPSRWA